MIWASSAGQRRDLERTWWQVARRGGRVEEKGAAGSTGSRMEGEKLRRFVLEVLSLDPIA